jgi:hypothetical protein
VTLHAWSNWKRLPSADSGNNLEAPIGAGLYEVRNALTGHDVAFGSADNVADALSTLNFNGFRSRFWRVFRGQPRTLQVSELEYRTLATASRAEADTAAHYLSGRRHTAMSKRISSWMTRQLS